LDEPKIYRAIMVSSTFTDLKEHRQKAIEAIQKFGFKANVMEHDGARADVNMIESSLKMVRDSVGYLCVISLKYGQTPNSSKSNPNQLSITELEFNEALRLRLPILLFIMGDDHPTKKADVERDAVKIAKLDAFRERAKRESETSEVNRVYEEFESLEHFAQAAAIAVGRLARDLDQKDGTDDRRDDDRSESAETLPRPPALVALPKYLGSHSFVGRASELQTLNDWCGAADPNPMLLFEAMGGSGKSMLTWEWLTRHAATTREDWAGRFWYSFYEKGAVMAGFCRAALAYITVKPVEDFARLRTPELSDRLLAELEKRPWLMVLDGLERVLVAYHRADAAQLRDDEVETAGDQIGKRDPCAAIRPEDDELLRRLAGAAPSKILVSSRLTPLALTNRSGLPVPGVRREILPGLRPPDAEALFRACGVTGASQAIQAYLQTNCDCHPLVIGALAGLINHYLPGRGNFDRWTADSHAGGALNLADLDLVQKRNHILLAAIDALAPESRQLLQTLALLQGGADFETLKALNPHLPPEPKAVPASATFERKQAYAGAVAAWRNDPAVRTAPARLGETIHDLEKRGLLQYDLNDKRYDLHPVVRGVAAGRMGGDETQTLGQKVVDHFNSQPHNPWEQAETLEDVAPGMQVMRVLLRMRQYKEAFSSYRGDLAHTLRFNLGADAEIQALLKPFFPDGWDGEPVPLDDGELSYLLNDAALSLSDGDPDRSSGLLERNIALDIRRSDATEVVTALQNLGVGSLGNNRLAESARLRSLALEIAEAMPNDELVFRSKLALFVISVSCGDRETADHLWQEIDGMGRDWGRATYRPGDAETWRAFDLFYRGELTEAALAQAETLARGGRNRTATQDLHGLRGEWHLARDEPARAAASLAEVVRMAREVGGVAARAEALLALARLRAGERSDARGEADRLSQRWTSLAIAELWRELGDRDRAVEDALSAHDWAVADGEPYVRRYDLDRTRALLSELGAELPEVPRHDPSTVRPFPWEKDVRALIDKLRAEREAKEAERKADGGEECGVEVISVGPGQSPSPRLS